MHTVAVIYADASGGHAKRKRYIAIGGAGNIGYFPADYRLDNRFAFLAEIIHI